MEAEVGVRHFEDREMSMNQEMQVASRSQKRQGNEFSLRFSRRERFLLIP